MLAAAVGLGLATGGRSAGDSVLPSVLNPGPGGTRVLHTWLAETGGRVETLSAPLTTIPEGVEVLVVPAPSARLTIRPRSVSKRLPTLRLTRSISRKVSSLPRSISKRSHASQ